MCVWAAVVLDSALLSLVVYHTDVIKLYLTSEK